MAVWFTKPPYLAKYLLLLFRFWRTKQSNGFKKIVQAGTEKMPESSNWAYCQTWNSARNCDSPILALKENTVYSIFALSFQTWRDHQILAQVKLPAMY